MTFYAFLPAYDSKVWDGEELTEDGERVMARAISEAEANARKGALRLEVNSLSYLFQEGLEYNRFQFHGPRIPLEIGYEPPRSPGDFSDQNSDGLIYLGGPSYVEHPQSNWGWATEDIQIEFEFEEWPADGPKVGFVLQYEAASAMVYDWAYTWMNIRYERTREMRFRTDAPAGLGLTSFKVYTTLSDDTPVGLPFWTDVLNCTELV